MGQINPLVALALPTWGKVSVNWARAFRHIGGPLGVNMVELAPVVGKPIAEARNELMQAAIANKCGFIFFIGDDVLPGPDSLPRLLQRMWEHPEIHLITGMYWTKTVPTQPYIWRGIQRGPYLDWKHGEFLEVDAAGCDCLLIRLSAEIQALGPEWFSTAWTWEQEDQSLLMLATEDFYFYAKARKAGLKLWCDTLVQCLHEDRESGAQFGLSTDMPQCGGIEPELPVPGTDVAPLVKLADLGSGFENPYFGRPDRVKVVRFDGNELTKPDYRCDLRHLPVPDQSFDVVHSRHVLEHFGRADTPKVLKEWLRILRIGGEFRLSVPNILSAIQHILLMEEGLVRPDPYPFWQLYGQQTDHRDFHANGFTPKRVQLLLERMGVLEEIEVTTGDGENGQMNIYARARKARHETMHALLSDWDKIEELEGITLEGHSNGNLSLSAGTLVEAEVAEAAG